VDVKPVALVLADISGYTEFLTKKSVSLAHAEALITDLLETVIDTAEFPLVLNKLEGDAAFLYAPFSKGDEGRVAADVLRQVVAFQGAFAARRDLLVTNRMCECDACRQLERLRLKSFLHLGEALFKRVRQFEELAGQDVILVHRLMKNTVEGREYLLATEAFASAAGAAPEGFREERRRETLEGMGEVACRVYHPSDAPPSPAPKGVGGKMRFLGVLYRGALRRLFGRARRRP
jgi:hypothetical protein